MASSCGSAVKLLPFIEIKSTADKCPFFYGVRFRKPYRSSRLNPLRTMRLQAATQSAVLMANPTMDFPSSSICDLDLLRPFDPFPRYNFDTKRTTREGKEEKENHGREDLEAWLMDSIGEIVRNIRDAPLLVQIFSSGGGPWASPSVVVKLDRDAASPERWSCIKKMWGHESRAPDGVILVEELKDEDEEVEDRGGDDGRCCSRSWGLVVQGRGMDCIACYILNTCRVRSSVGFCTHFCLVRAKCFGETTQVQFRNAWLQGR